MVQGWLRIPKAAAEYAAVGERTFENFLRDGLRFVKVGGCRMTKPEWVDAYLMKFESPTVSKVDAVVEDVLRSIR